MCNVRLVNIFGWISTHFHGLK